MNCSVIVCSRNRLEFLIRFTESLYSQNLLPDEYIIVDSSDQPINRNNRYKTEIERKKPNGTILKYFHTTPGLTFQRNFGVSKAKGDIIFFFDDDIVLEKNYIKEIMNVFNKNPEYYAGMGNIVSFENPSFFTLFKENLRGFFGLNRSYGDGKFYLSGFPKHPYGKKEFMDTQVLGGGLTAYRKVVFEEFSFDENVTGYSFMEDVDFSRRVSYKYKCFYQPSARCEHLHANGGRGSIKENRKMLMVNFRYFYFKNFYGRNKYSILAHWFAILGLFLFNFSFERKMGLFLGLKEFYHRKKELFKDGTI